MSTLVVPVSSSDIYSLMFIRSYLRHAKYEHRTNNACKNIKAMMKPEKNFHGSSFRAVGPTKKPYANEWDVVKLQEFLSYLNYKDFVER